MIVGLGLDIAEIDRIEAAIARHGASLIERLFTPREAAYCESHRDKFERYAGRFAAKEAANVIPEPSVPLFPAVSNKVADLIQARGIPRFGNQLRTREPRVRLNVPEYGWVCERLA